jgi:hypothetical protein
MIALEQRASEPIVSEVFKRALLRRWDLQDASGATAARAAVRRCSHSMAWLWQTETRRREDFSELDARFQCAERPLAAVVGCRTGAAVIAVTILEAVVVL